LRRRDPVIRVGPNNPISQVIATKQLQHIADFRKEQAYVERDPPAVALAEVAGARTVVIVPMLKENWLVGVIAIYRQEVRLLSIRQTRSTTWAQLSCVSRHLRHDRGQGGWSGLWRPQRSHHHGLQHVIHQQQDQAIEQHVHRPAGLRE
jgi:hypothetical protein